MAGDLYSWFLLATATARNVDTATLHHYADAYMIQTAEDAVKYNLLDGVKYDDEVKNEIRTKLGIGENDKIEFVSIGSYAEASSLKKYRTDRIAVIYAEGILRYGREPTAR